MPSAYFVSDIHIVAPDDERAALFRAFLGGLSGDRNITHLFLMGDIFDLWVADHRYFVDRYEPIVAEIRRLRDEGVEIHYFEGNHDLHLQRYWQQELGLQVHTDSAYLRVGHYDLRLEHGDLIDRDDRGYLFLRWFLRTPAIRFLICHLPGTLIARIGNRASASSRSYTSNRKLITNTDAIAKIRTHAERTHAERAFDLMVSGHLHIRDDFEFDGANGRFRSINLGSWIDGPCYLHIDDDGVRLVDIPEEQAGAAVSPRPARVGTVP